jgi:polyisoprenoid-binding protein YceI
MHRSHALAALALAALLVPATWAAAHNHSNFVVRKDGGSRITFVSNAPLETITGVTSQVSGSLRVDPNDLSTVSGRVEAPVASFRTGIDLRDEHLRSDNWLNAEKNPNVVFEVDKVTGASKLERGKTISFKIHGKATLNGITRPVVADAKARFYPLEELRGTMGIDGDVIRGRARFTLKLSDHDVGIPAAVRLKVANEITINIDLRAIREG